MDRKAMKEKLRLEVERQRQKNEAVRRKFDGTRDHFYDAVRRALGEGRGEVGVMKHRLIVNADLVFDPFTDRITRSGRSTMQTIANNLNRFIQQLPEQSDWTLEVDVHACDSDIEERMFPSTMAQTKAQGEVLRDVLISSGIPTSRLLINAYGKEQTIDKRKNSEQGAKRNRRIEIRLSDPNFPADPKDVEPAEVEDEEPGWKSINPADEAEKARSTDSQRPGTPVPRAVSGAAAGAPTAPASGRGLHPPRMPADNWPPPMAESNGADRQPSKKPADNWPAPSPGAPKQTERQPVMVPMENKGKDSPSEEGENQTLFDRSRSTHTWERKVGW